MYPALNVLWLFMLLLNYFRVYYLFCIIYVCINFILFYLLFNSFAFYTMHFKPRIILGKAIFFASNSEHLERNYMNVNFVNCLFLLYVFNLFFHFAVT